MKIMNDMKLLKLEIVSNPEYKKHSYKIFIFSLLMTIAYLILPIYLGIHVFAISSTLSLVIIIISFIITPFIYYYFKYTSITEYLEEFQERKKDLRKLVLYDATISTIILVLAIIIIGIN